MNNGISITSISELRDLFSKLKTVQRYNIIIVLPPIGEDYLVSVVQNFMWRRNDRGWEKKWYICKIYD